MPSTAKRSLVCCLRDELAQSRDRDAFIRARRKRDDHLVAVPSELLRGGVVFVDTPGVGSIASSGARETYSYLPRCDLGVVLVDAGGSPNAEDLELVRLLYESAIPATVLVSKSDLVSGEDLERLRA